MTYSTGTSPIPHNDGSHGSDEDTGQALAVALLAFFLGVIGALIGWFITKDSNSLYLRRHGSMVLKYILSYTLYIFILMGVMMMFMVIGGAGEGESSSIALLAFIPAIAMLALAVANFVFAVILIVKASKAELYRPPGTIGKS